MKYICLIYNEESRLRAMSKDEYESLAKEHLALDDELEESGHLIASDALRPVQDATTIRLRNGNLSVTDGPFAETKEQLGGFYLIEARDLNEAIRIAGRIPSARTGSIEVRPISPDCCVQP